jgi:Xaa-Pro dipeptidase
MTTATTDRWVQAESLRERARAAGLDCTVGFSPEAVLQLSGATIPSQRSIRERLAFVIVPAEGEPELVTSTMEVNLAKRLSKIASSTYVEFAESPAIVLAERLKQRGLASGRIGLEMMYLFAGYYEQLRRALPQAAFVEADYLIKEGRKIKSPEEVEFLQRAANISLKAVRSVFEEAHEGDTERSLLTRILTRQLEAGLSYHHGSLSAGPHTAINHHRAGDYQIQRGDLIRIDTGGTLNGYISDIARMAVVGKPSERQAQAYALTREAERRAVSACRAGTPARAVFEAVRSTYEGSSLEFTMPHVGHGVGIDGHEIPLLNPFEEMPLQPGMVLYLEPIALDPGHAMYHVEDLVLVTDGDPVILTDWADGDELFQID